MKMLSHSSVLRSSCWGVLFRRSVLSRHNSTTQSSPIVEVLGKTYPTDNVTNITPAIISKLTKRLYAQPAHPICTLKNLIESHFPRYSHLSSLSPVVTTKQNFDDLSFPQDHPGRSVTDTYYINKELLLRTHTSAHEVEVFAQEHSKWLLTADVYRRDEIDASHYPAFHQMEGACLFPADSSGSAQLAEENEAYRAAMAQENIVMEDETIIDSENPFQGMHDPQQASLVVENLKHSLNSLLLKLFSKAAGVSATNPLRVRWITAYFPFTSPSYEVEVFYQGKWLEILGCGVVLQATLDKANISNKIGWAFGLGLERIAMILYSIPDIRLFWSEDPRFLSQFQVDTLSTFKPYSKYPACYKDISFWLPQTGLHTNDFCDLVRLTAGDLAESVELIDSFTHPKSNRNSVCYRINYRSMDRSLSNDEVNVIHSLVTSKLKNEVGVEIR